MREYVHIYHAIAMSSAAILSFAVMFIRGRLIRLLGRFFLFLVALYLSQSNFSFASSCSGLVDGGENWDYVTLARLRLVQSPEKYKTEPVTLVRTYKDQFRGRLNYLFKDDRDGLMAIARNLYLKGRSSFDPDGSGIDKEVKNIATQFSDLYERQLQALGINYFLLIDRNHPYLFIFPEGNRPMNRFAADVFRARKSMVAFDPLTTLQTRYDESKNIIFLNPDNLIDGRVKLEDYVVAEAAEIRKVNEVIIDMRDPSMIDVSKLNPAHAQIGGLTFLTYVRGINSNVEGRVAYRSGVIKTLGVLNPKISRALNGLLRQKRAPEERIVMGGLRTPDGKWYFSKKYKLTLQTEYEPLPDVEEDLRAITEKLLARDETVGDFFYFDYGLGQFSPESRDWIQEVARRDAPPYKSTSLVTLNKVKGRGIYYIISFESRVTGTVEMTPNADLLWRTYDPAIDEMGRGFVSVDN